MRALYAFSILAAATGVSAASATAATITENFTITASSFIDIIGNNVPPADPISLTFRLSFDPSTGDQFDDMAGIALLNSSIPVAGFAFDYDSTNDILTIGGAGLGGVGITAGTNDVLADIDTVYTGTPTLADFAYVSSSSTGLFEANAGGVTVPEPAAVTIMLAGLAALGLIRRRA